MKRNAMVDPNAEAGTEPETGLLRETAHLYARAARLLDPVRLQIWEAMGVTFPQLRILFRVRAHPGIDVRGLATQLAISPSATSQQVDKLVARGFLVRNEDRDDRRHVRLDLTDLGRQAAGEISRATRTHVEGVLSLLDRDELATLRDLLDRIVAGAAGAEPGREPAPAGDAG